MWSTEVSAEYAWLEMAAAEEPVGHYVHVEDLGKHHEVRPTLLPIVEIASTERLPMRHTADVRPFALTPQEPEIRIESQGHAQSGAGRRFPMILTGAVTGLTSTEADRLVCMICRHAEAAGARDTADDKDGARYR
ncbi:hypothetical protein [Streptomyces sp. NPDC004284]|uniref:hypothetical protein n=1 Tax=Streptomyces sp. NPDC004284 TaxID=3364695 RepID=UPI00367F7F63